MTNPAAPTFGFVPGVVVHGILADSKPEILKLVEDAYLLHGAGHTINSPSYFLRFPDEPSARLIALLAAARGEGGVDGLKWISSYPGNLRRGLPRASAVLILNDPDTGYPFACLEGLMISAASAAASAALAAKYLLGQRRGSVRVGFFRAGLIARYLYDYLQVTSPTSTQCASSTSQRTVRAVWRSASGTIAGAGNVRICSSPEELVRSCDVVVLSATAARPHVPEPAWFSHNPPGRHRGPVPPGHRPASGLLSLRTRRAGPRRRVVCPSPCRRVRRADDHRRLFQ